MGRNAIAITNKHANSKIGNNKSFLDGVDGRTKGARRYRELLARISLELASKNRRPVQEHEMALLRRAVSLAMLSEQQDTRLANGEQVDGREYAAITNAFRRLLNDVGLIIPAELKIRM